MEKRGGKNERPDVGHILHNRNRRCDPDPDSDGGLHFQERAQEAAKLGALPERDCRGGSRPEWSQRAASAEVSTSEQGHSPERPCLLFVPRRHLESNHEAL